MIKRFWSLTTTSGLLEDSGTLHSLFCNSNSLEEAEM
jgi:hypothetical protein